MVFLANDVKKKVNVLEENRLVFSASEDHIFFVKCSSELMSPLTHRPNQIKDLIYFASDT